MQKPEVSFYPIIDLLDVEGYLSDLYGEEVDLLTALFDNNVINDIYVDYFIEEPEKEYHGAYLETEEEWNIRNKFEKYLWEEFSNFKMVILRICW